MGKAISRHIVDTYIVAIKTLMIGLRSDFKPDRRSRWILGPNHLPSLTSNGSDPATYWPLITPDHDYCWRAEAVQINTRCVDDVRQILINEVLFNQLAPKRPFHEGIRNDHCHETSRSTVFRGCYRKIEETLEKWATQLIFPIARQKALPIAFSQHRIADIIIGWVPDHDVIFLA